MEIITAGQVQLYAIIMARRMYTRIEFFHTLLCDL